MEKKTNWKSQKWDLCAIELTTSKIEMSKSHEEAILCEFVPPHPTPHPPHKKKKKKKKISL